jgi:hypothetical protein
MNPDPKRDKAASGKRYLAVLDENTTMGSGLTYKMVDGVGVGKIRLYGDFVRLYELASPQPLSKE